MSVEQNGPNMVYHAVLGQAKCLCMIGQSNTGLEVQGVLPERVSYFCIIIVKIFSFSSILENVCDNGLLDSQQISESEDDVMVGWPRQLISNQIALSGSLRLSHRRTIR